MPRPVVGRGPGPRATAASVPLEWRRDGSEHPGTITILHGGQATWTGQLRRDVSDPDLLQALDHDDLEAALDRLTLHHDPAATASDLNAQAWALLTEPGPKSNRTLGLSKAREAVALSPEPAHLDTLARGLWLHGDEQAALTMQRRALAETDPHSPLYLELLASLHEYERRPGLDRTPGPAWFGTLNAALSTDDRLLSGPDESRLLALTKQFGGSVVPVGADLSAPGTRVLYGRPEDHPGLAAVLDHHGITIDPGGVTIGRRRVEVHHPFFIGALPHPSRPEEPVVVYAASAEGTASGLNAVFHGPTQAVVGTTDRLRDTPWFAGSLRPGDAGRVVGTEACAAPLSSADILNDLATLEAQLHAGYAGLEDIDRRLSETGGWSAHVAQVRGAIAARDTWTCTAAFDALDALLAPVIDTHFTFVGLVEGGDGRTERWARRHVTSWAPLFADGLVEDRSGTLQFQGRPLELVPPVVPPVDESKLGTLYRFPTLTPDGAPAWLLGAFTTDSTTAPPVTLDGVPLPLHPARTWRTTRSTAPMVLRHHNDVPVLDLTTMDTTRLAGLPDTTEGFADEPLAILDLRGNTGGSDSPAIAWTRRLHHGPYAWSPAADLTPGTAPRLGRWQGWAPSLQDTPDGPVHTGRVYVLTDPRVASSGDAFVQLARQLPGAVHVGLHTAGCSEYGNVVEQPPLPHTRFQAAFGLTRFVWTAVHPVVEGRGTFPELWLDVDDPVDVLTRLPRASATPGDGEDEPSD